MSDISERIAKLSPKRLALLTLELEARLKAAGPRPSSEPLAIVGVGCRFPGGASNPDRFWQLLRDGDDAIAEVPGDRWDVDAYYDPDPDAPGKMNTRWGGFIDGVDRFDAPFFGISPREAVHMDPQQRILLEVSWEALEHAGQSPESLLGTRTGVFVGISGSEYAQIRRAQPGLADVDAYVGSGNATSIAAGRLAYCLGLNGPCLAIDTACSSSLVAVHLACQSLRRGECRTALAAGVNLILNPAVYVILSRAHMMSPAGRCKAFDASADGYVRGEGCGVVVLKRLADAQADGDRILAVILGSAVNHDGRSSGLTVPNGLAQENLIAAALADAGVEPHDVSYLETHGTGTSLGDPIEVQALAAALARNRVREAPLLIGSVKTNIGHLEAAAGIAGLIKLVLSIEHGAIPPHLHFSTPNPLVPWDELAVKVAAEPSDWPAVDGRRIGGVSSFSFSGTNAHLVVADPPSAVAVEDEPERPQHVLVLSARTETVLRDLGKRYVEHLSSVAETSTGDVCFTAAVGRSRFEHRLAIVGSTLDQMRRHLSEYLAGEAVPSVFTGAGLARPEIAFVFSGEGAEYVGMGRELYETLPVFRAAILRCDAELRTATTVSLESILYDGDAASLDKITHAQPALFAIEYALAETWRSWGIAPAAVLGHGVGEYVAACVAGVLTVEDALRLVVSRARIAAQLPTASALIAVHADRSDVQGLLDRQPGLAIAAVNGAGQVVLSGPIPAVEEAIAVLTNLGIHAERLPAPHPFYTSAVDPVLDEFEAEAAKVRIAPPQIDLVSSVTGRIVGHEIERPRYWTRHARETVQFSQGIRTLAARGFRTFLEVGPTPVLAAARASFGEIAEATCVASLQHGRSDWLQMLESVAQLYAGGAPIDWRSFDAGRRRRKMALPTYAFERRRYWIDEASAAPASGGDATAATVHDDWIYDVDWEPRPATAAGVGDPGDWLIFVDRSGVGDRLIAALESRGHRCVRVSRSDRFRRLDERALACALSAEDIGRTVDLFRNSAGCPQGVVYLWPVDSSMPDDASSAWLHDASSVGVATVLRLVQQLSAAAVPLPAGLCLVTRGAQQATTVAAPINPGAAAVWGIGRTIATEYPALWGGLVDLDPEADPQTSAEALLGAIGRADREDQSAFRAGERLVPRLGRRRGPAIEGRLEFRPDAAYVVTGGFGALGTHVATWLAQRGARRIILIGRHGVPARCTWRTLAPDSPEARRTSAVLAIEKTGATVECVAMDIADETALAEWLDRYDAEQRPPIRGIVHAAGVLQYRALADQDEMDVRDVWHGKVDGAWALHRRFRSPDALDFFVMFSSAAAVLHSPMLGSYAAANAALDAIAEYRRFRGLPALSINWGMWSLVGSVGEAPQTNSGGERGIAGEEGTAILERLLVSDAGRATVLPIDWSDWRRRHPESAFSRMIERVADTSVQASNGGGAMMRASRKAAVLALEGADREQLVVDIVADAVQAILRVTSADLDREAPLRTAGLDSLTALELRNRVQFDTGIALPLVAVVQGPSVVELAASVCRLLSETRPAENGSTASVENDRERLLAMLDDLSEERVDSLLRRMLAGQNG